MGTVRSISNLNWNETKGEYPRIIQLCTNKIIRECVKTFEEKGMYNSIVMGPSNKRINTNLFAFADDLVIFAELRMREGSH